MLLRAATPNDLDTTAQPGCALVGGADLLRAALSRQVEEGTAVEIARLGRFSEEAIDSFFKRIRGVEFSSPGALQRVIAVTGGVPLLVERLSKCFVDGATVDGAQLESALAAVRKALPAVARELVEGVPERRLARRECELLVGVLAASRLTDSVPDVLCDDGLLQEAVAGFLQPTPESVKTELKIYSVGPGDNEHLALLLHLGLLLRRPLGQAPGWALSEVGAVPEDDVLWTLGQYIVRALTT